MSPFPCNKLLNEKSLDGVDLVLCTDTQGIVYRVFTLTNSDTDTWADG